MPRRKKKRGGKKKKKKKKGKRRKKKGGTSTYHHYRAVRCPDSHCVPIRLYTGAFGDVGLAVLGKLKRRKNKKAKKHAAWLKAAEAWDKDALCDVIFGADGLGTYPQRPPPRPPLPVHSGMIRQARLRRAAHCEARANELGIDPWAEAKAAKEAGKGGKGGKGKGAKGGMKGSKSGSKGSKSGARGKGKGKGKKGKKGALASSTSAQRFFLMNQEDLSLYTGYAPNYPLDQCAMEGRVLFPNCLCRRAKYRDASVLGFSLTIGNFVFAFPRREFMMPSGAMTGGSRYRRRAHGRKYGSGRDGLLLWSGGSSVPNRLGATSRTGSGPGGRGLKSGTSTATKGTAGVTPGGTRGRGTASASLLPGGTVGSGARSPAFARHDGGAGSPWGGSAAQGGGGGVGGGGGGRAVNADAVQYYVEGRRPGSEGSLISLLMSSDDEAVRRPPPLPPHRIVVLPKELKADRRSDVRDLIPQDTAVRIYPGSISDCSNAIAVVRVASQGLCRTRRTRVRVRVGGARGRLRRQAERRGQESHPVARPHRARALERRQRARVPAGGPYVVLLVPPTKYRDTSVWG